MGRHHVNAFFLPFAVHTRLINLVFESTERKKKKKKKNETPVPVCLSTSQMLRWREVAVPMALLLRNVATLSTKS